VRCYGKEGKESANFAQIGRNLGNIATFLFQNQLGSLRVLKLGENFPKVKVTKVEGIRQLSGEMFTFSKSDLC